MVKETQLTVVDSSDIATQKIEQRYYRELLGGFFEKLIRWQAIADEYPTGKRFSAFDVLQTPTGLINSHPDPQEKYGEEKPDRVLRVGYHIRLYIPEHRLFTSEFLIRPGPAGEHLLVDPDGRLLKEVRIEVNEQRPTKIPVQMQSLRVSTEYSQYSDTVRDRYSGVRYELGRGQVEIKRYLFSPLMSDAYATHLFDTIDALIPGTPTATPQPGRRPTPEPRASGQIPAPQRRRTPRG